MPRVLVVDDREDILELLGEYLRARGLPVETAYDVLEAGRVAESGAVDVVLTDLNLDDRSGIDLIRRLQPLRGQVATIAMTGFPSVPSAVEVMKLGARDYICKPFRLGEVYDAVLSAGVELERERAMTRRTSWLRLLEEVVRIREPSELTRVYGLLANVAMSDCGAAEVALWVLGPSGFEAVARGGEVRILQGLEPSKVRQPRETAELSVRPVMISGQVAAVVAVAGGAPRRDAHHVRMAELAFLLEQAMDRVGWEDLSARSRLPVRS